MPLRQELRLDVGDGLLVVNQRGMVRTALVGPGDRAAKWTSRYGSVTFNQYGRDSLGRHERGRAGRSS